MNNLSGFPYCEIQFTKEGILFDPQAVNQLEDMLKDEDITDLFVISHGWNNDMDEARELYKNLVAIIAKQAGLLIAGNRKFAVLGVLWPSKKFAEKDLIAGGGAASISTEENAEGLAGIMTQLENLQDFFDDEAANEIIKKARITAPNLEKDPDAQIDFVKQMNDILINAIKKESAGTDEETITNLSSLKPADLLVKLSDDWTDAGGNGHEGAAGLNFEETGNAAGLGDFFGGIFSGARNLMNYVTFFQMKERAGKVGSLGLNPVLKYIHGKLPEVKLHLIGHSFGGRLVTAAVAGADENDSLQVDTLTLLQAAFSHYGFAEKYDEANNGFFRRVISTEKVLGPIIVSHTHNDTAVGIAYAIAARIAGQVALGIGDAGDRFGGLGGNGAQKTPEANNDFSLKINEYNFKKGFIYNLNGDSCISGHSDICKEEVGKAIIASVASIAG